MNTTIHGHLIDLGGVVLLNVSQDPDVIIFHKVDGHTLTAIATRPTNPERSKVILAIFSIQTLRQSVTSPGFVLQDSSVKGIKVIPESKRFCSNTQVAGQFAESWLGVRKHEVSEHLTCGCRALCCWAGHS